MIIDDLEGGVGGGGVPGDIRTAIGVGVYDGIHKGHQHVFAKLRAQAEASGCAPAVVTFDQHPALVLRPQNAPRLLTTLDQKLELLEAQGIEYCYLVRFDAEQARETPDDFVRRVFVEALHASVVVVGEDFHFGADRAGNVARLEQLGADHDFRVEGLTLIRTDPEAPEPVSSTVIRRSLAGGDVAAAADMLGRPYEVRGTVIEGDQRGRTIGFPTANIPVNAKMAWPADGVYSGWYLRPDGTRHPAAINIGRRPTFHEHAEHSVLEAHLLDFEGDLYGEQARVQFVDFLRSEQRFDGIDGLVAQLKIDIEAARSSLGA